MLYRRKSRARLLELLGFKFHKENLVKWRTSGLSAVALFGIAAFTVLQLSAESPAQTEYFSDSSQTLRRLLAEESNATSHCEFEKNHLPNAWVFSHCLCILIIFIALAIICDDFFVPSLEIISEKLNLSEDVAGATFMAAGSSAPELFTSVAGVAQETDVGIGTIVGSAVFNLLIIIALTAALAGQVLTLDWRPLIRDSFFYAMSIGCFIGFAWDGYFQHYESAILLSLYALYILLMVFNPKIMDWMGTWSCCLKTEVAPQDGDAEKGTDNHLNHLAVEPEHPKDGRRISLTGGHARRISIIQRERSHSEERLFHHKRGSVAGVLICPPPPRHTAYGSVHRKDSGFQSHENSSYLASTDTSHTDLQRGTPDSQYFGDKLKPPHIRNGYLAASGGDAPSDDIEMTTVELPAITKNGTVSPDQHPSHLNRARDHHLRYQKAFSEDTYTVQEETDESPYGSKNVLHRSVSCDQSKSNHSASVEPKLPPIQTDSNNVSETSLSQPLNPDNKPSSPENQTGSSQTCNSAQPLVSDAPKSQSPTCDSPDLYPSDSALQHSIHIRKLSQPAIEHDKEEKKEEEEEEEEEEETINVCPCCPCCPLVRTHPPSADDVKEKGGCLPWFKLILRWIIFIPAFPFVCLFSWTIPDCSKDHLKKYYILSFVMSVAWIAALSFCMVTLVERAGCILGIDSYIMGLVIVAIGTSIPDALSSILVARDGYGDMAVSNAIGSNVFDINLGLGLPFIIRIAIDKGAPITLLDLDEWVDFYNGHMGIMPHAKFGFILLLILVLALAVFGMARFKLNKWIGICFVIMYFSFLTYAFVQELYCVRQLGDYC